MPCNESGISRAEEVAPAFKGQNSSGDAASVVRESRASPLGSHVKTEPDADRGETSVKKQEAEKWRSGQGKKNRSNRNRRRAYESQVLRAGERAHHRGWNVDMRYGMGHNMGHVFSKGHMYDDSYTLYNPHRSEMHNPDWNGAYAGTGGLLPNPCYVHNENEGDAGPLLTVSSVNWHGFKSSDDMPINPSDTYNKSIMYNMRQFPPNFTHNQYLSHMCTLNRYDLPHDTDLNLHQNQHQNVNENSSPPEESLSSLHTNSAVAESHADIPVLETKKYSLISQNIPISPRHRRWSDVVPSTTAYYSHAHYYPQVASSSNYSNISPISTNNHYSQRNPLSSNCFPLCSTSSASSSYFESALQHMSASEVNQVECGAGFVAQQDFPSVHTLLARNPERFPSPSLFQRNHYHQQPLVLPPKGPPAELPLYLQRYSLCRKILKAARNEGVVDLGCGSGIFLSLFVHDEQVEKLVGVEVSAQSLANADVKLRHGGGRIPPLGCLGERSEPINSVEPQGNREGQKTGHKVRTHALKRAPEENEPSQNVEEVNSEICVKQLWKKGDSLRMDLKDIEKFAQVSQNVIDACGISQCRYNPLSITLLNHSICDIPSLRKKSGGSLRSQCDHQSDCKVLHHIHDMSCVLIEVIEHIVDLPNLHNALFNHMQPSLVIITTPCKDFNPVYQPSTPPSFYPSISTPFPDPPIQFFMPHHSCPIPLSVPPLAWPPLMYPSPHHSNTSPRMRGTKEQTSSPLPPQNNFQEQNKQNNLSSQAGTEPPRDVGKEPNNLENTAMLGSSTQQAENNPSNCRHQTARNRPQIREDCPKIGHDSTHSVENNPQGAKNNLKMARNNPAIRMPENVEQKPGNVKNASTEFERHFLRHSDNKFEWSRATFRRYCDNYIVGNGNLATSDLPCIFDSDLVPSPKQSASRCLQYGVLYLGLDGITGGEDVPAKGENGEGSARSLRADLPPVASNETCPCTWCTYMEDDRCDDAICLCCLCSADDMLVIYEQKEGVFYLILSPLCVRDSGSPQSSEEIGCIFDMPLKLYRCKNMSEYQKNHIFAYSTQIAVAFDVEKFSHKLTTYPKQNFRKLGYKILENSSSQKFYHTKVNCVCRDFYPATSSGDISSSRTIGEDRGGSFLQNSKECGEGIVKNIENIKGTGENLMGRNNSAGAGTAEGGGQKMGKSALVKRITAKETGNSENMLENGEKMADNDGNMAENGECIARNGEKDIFENSKKDPSVDDGSDIENTINIENIRMQEVLWPFIRHAEFKRMHYLRNELEICLNGCKRKNAREQIRAVLSSQLEGQGTATRRIVNLPLHGASTVSALDLWEYARTTQWLCLDSLQQLLFFFIQDTNQYLAHIHSVEEEGWGKEQGEICDRVSCVGESHTQNDGKDAMRLLERDKRDLLQASQKWPKFVLSKAKEANRLGFQLRSHILQNFQTKSKSEQPTHNILPNSPAEIIPNKNKPSQIPTLKSCLQKQLVQQIPLLTKLTKQDLAHVQISHLHPPNRRYSR